MDVAYINPFLTGVRSLFATMVKLPLELGKPRLRGADNQMHRIYPVTADIRLSGGVTGIVFLSFSAPVACAVAAALGDRKVTDLDRDGIDALAEAANMVVGSAKKDLPGGLTKVSLPKVVATQALTYPPNLPVIVIPGDVGCGRFLIEVALAPAAPAATRAA
ncbi:MAG TPA: chemotaxis protein CheX [Tepidisphaeraceae bacterium]|nr:chemotaxis protein CheX [Tepidisphaeraceae bacterium]